MPIFFMLVYNNFIYIFGLNINIFKKVNFKAIFLMFKKEKNKCQKIINFDVL